jgi:acyl carrier protein
VRRIRPMKTSEISPESLRAQLAIIIAQLFRLDIDPDNAAENEFLVDGRLELDSVDRIELTIFIEEAFGVAVGGEEESRRAFRSIANLAEFIHARSAAADRPIPAVAAFETDPVHRGRPAYSFPQVFSVHPSTSPNAIQG